MNSEIQYRGNPFSMKFRSCIHFSLIFIASGMNIYQTVTIDSTNTAFSLIRTTNCMARTLCIFSGAYSRNCLTFFPRMYLLRCLLAFHLKNLFSYVSHMHNKRSYSCQQQWEPKAASFLMSGLAYKEDVGSNVV